MNQSGSLGNLLQPGQAQPLGARSESEAAFQEFLKRIPSATALSGQAAEERPLFGSTSTNSLLNLAAVDVPQGMKQVASLDMLRTLCDTRDPRAAEGLAQLQSQHGAALSPQHAQLFHASPAQGAAAPAAPTGRPDSSAAPAAQVDMGQVPAAAFLAYQHSVQNAAAQSVPSPAAPQAPDPSTSNAAGPSSQDQQDAPSHSTAGGTSAAPRRSAAGAVAKKAAVSFDDDNGGGAHSGKLDDRRARRMLSNRESARRSRRRKQEQLQVLEDHIAELQRRAAELEEARAAAQASVQGLLAEKGRLENENQHLTAIFTHLQRSLGKETICKHLPPALAGTGAAVTAAAAAPANADAAASAGNAKAPGEAASVVTAAAGASAPHEAGVNVGAKREWSPTVGEAGEDAQPTEADAEGSRRSRRKPVRTPLRS